MGVPRGVGLGVEEEEAGIYGKPMQAYATACEMAAPEKASTPTAQPTERSSKPRPLVCFP